MRLLREDQAEAGQSEGIDSRNRLDIERSGNRGHAHGAAYVAHGAIVAGQIAFCGMLVKIGMRVASIMGCVQHAMLYGLLTVLADKHAGRGVALQRQPQHDEDQNEFTQKKRHFLFGLQGLQ